PSPLGHAIRNRQQARRCAPTPRRCVAAPRARPYRTCPIDPVWATTHTGGSLSCMRGTLRRAAAVLAMILLLPVAGPTGVLAREVSAAPAGAPERATNWIVTVQRGVDARSAAPGLARKVGGKAG